MLRGFLFIPVPVEGNSMENVLKQGDMVVMEKFSEIRRFDIVVFQLADGTIYIKRVIGLNSKAWKILKRAEEDLDMPLVERISGGKDGGGSKLTQEGEELLEKYEKFIQEMNEYAKIRFKEIFEDE